jgi:hypothetical protein
LNMKNYLLTLIAFYCLSSKAIVAESFLIKQLSFVNKEWYNQKDVSKLLSRESSISSPYFNDYISCHLLLVEKTLRDRDVSKINASQRKRRAELLQVLHRYAIAKVFPKNDYLTYKNPIFIDRLGTHCAVGYLMQQSGSEELAREIDAKQKFAYVKDIKVAGVKEWAIENGFTIDELAWIQPGYPVSTAAFDMAEGLNGNVRAMCAPASGYPIFAAGSFTQTGNNIPCNYLAQYISGFAGFLWTAVGNDSPNGPIHAMVIENNKLYIGGEFTAIGSLTANHVACLDLTTYQWSAMGSVPGKVRALTFYNGNLYAGGDFTELIMKWDGSQWLDFPQGMMYGNNVRVLKAVNGELHAGGDFELATGALRKHAVKFVGSQMNPLGFGTITPVNDFAFYSNRLYAACDAVNGNDSCALAVFDNFDWQRVIIPNVAVGSMFIGKAIHKLQNVGQYLYCAGDFTCMNLMSFGNNLMSFEQQDTSAINNFQMQPLLNTDSAIHTMLLQNTSLFFGGDFTLNSYADTLKHVGSIEISTTSLKDHVTASQVKLYPIPTKEKLTLQCDEKMNSYFITDAFGKQIMQMQSVNQAIVDINTTSFSNGIYFIKVVTSHSVIEKQFVKQ